MHLSKVVLLSAVYLVTEVHAVPSPQPTGLPIDIPGITVPHFTEPDPKWHEKNHPQWVFIRSKGGKTVNALSCPTLQPNECIYKFPFMGGPAKPWTLKKGGIEWVFCYYTDPISKAVFYKAAGGHWFRGQEIEALGPNDVPKDKPQWIQDAAKKDSRQLIKTLGQCRTGVRYCPEGKEGAECATVADAPGTCLYGAAYSGLFGFFGKGIETVHLLAHQGWGGGEEEAAVHRTVRCEAFAKRVDGKCSERLQVFEEFGTWDRPNLENRKKIKGFQCW